MHVLRNIPPTLIWKFAWRNLLWFTFYSSVVTGAWVFFESRGVDIGIPYAPLGTIGVAVAFYVSFKNNQAYDRFWEGRKIWGGIVNESRTWANMVLSYWTDPEALPGNGRAARESSIEVLTAQRRVIYRQIAWMNALRVQLRRTTLMDRVDHLSYAPELDIPLDREFETELYQFLDPDERTAMCTSVNTATQLIRRQGEELKLALTKGYIDSFQEATLHGILREFYALQGKCERIKNTPLPRQFAYFSSLFVRVFTLLVPFAIVHSLAAMQDGYLIWLNVPFSVLISWIFMTLEAVGDNTEDPFENYINDVPMSALCRTIEIDLRQMLGETELPPKLEPVNGILM